MVSNTRNIVNLAKDFRELGFTEYEARVYVALLQNAPATAYEISKVHAMSRPNVYSALESLEAKQAVQRVNDDPVKYVPLEPKVLLERISRTVVERCTSLRERFEAIKVVDHTHYVWTLAGAADAKAKMLEMILRARRHIWIKAHQAELEPYLDALRKAATSGVSVLLVLFGEHEQLERFRFNSNTTVYMHEGGGVIVGFGRHLITLTVDFDEALIVNMKEESGAYTRSEPVVNLADSLIRHEIYLAEIFNRLGAELERQFGPALLTLRKKYLPSDQAKALERRLAR